MENITMTNTTQIPRVRSASPQAADRSLNAGVRGVFYASMHVSASKTPAATDASNLRPWRPPV